MDFENSPQVLSGTNLELVKQLGLRLPDLIQQATGEGKSQLQIREMIDAELELLLNQANIK